MYSAKDLSGSFAKENRPTLPEVPVGNLYTINITELGSVSEEKEFIVKEVKLSDQN